MGAYWYISRNKLEVLPRRRFYQRLFARLKLSVGLASIEGGVDSTRDPSLADAVTAAERRLRKKGEVAALSDDQKPPKAPYFEFEGPAVRSFQDDGLWIAVSSGDKAVLLAGSKKNAIGAGMADAGELGDAREVLSPSADPIGALASLRKGVRPERLDWGSLAYVWAALMTEGTEVVELAALPRVRGLAIYSGLGPTASGNWPIMESMAYAVVGTPLFVEQIG